MTNSFLLSKINLILVFRFNFKRYARAVFTVLACFLFFKSIVSQTLPDTLHYNHNNNLPGTQWAFTVVQITDIHLGETSAGGDYGTPGWNDTIDLSTGCPATDALRNVICWINNNYISEKIELVIVTGDLSDRGEKSGFIMAKRILDSLHVPYIVTNGNHDMWPRISGNEAPAPFGDSIFSEVFNNHLQLMSLQLNNWNDGTRLTRTYNPLNDIYSQFQNYAFTKGSYRFIINDFATRDKKPVGVGTMTDAALLNIAGGTYPWLSNALTNAQPDIANGIILVQHFPMDNELLSSTYSFSSSEYDSLIDIIEPFASDFGLCIAGHRHRNKTYNIKRSTFSPTLGIGIETDANCKYTNGMVRLLKFWDYPTAHIIRKLTNNVRIFPNPAKDNIILAFDKKINLSNLSIEIYNANGVMCYNQMGFLSYKIVIPLHSFAPGFYFVKAVSENWTENIKFIVQND